MKSSKTELEHQINTLRMQLSASERIRSEQSSYISRLDNKLRLFRNIIRILELEANGLETVDLNTPDDLANFRDILIEFRDNEKLGREFNKIIEASKQHPDVDALVKQLLVLLRLHDVKIDIDI